MITKIEIRNFRSIERMSLDCKDITTFIGENDAGKSNILRALNLFFNNETDYGQPFDFDRDWNRNAKMIRGKAKEIRIVLTLKLPKSYIREGLPQLATWRKIWREDGLQNEKEKQSYIRNQPFKERSKIPTLLSRIQFRYVPAVKDRNFFAKLQGDLYKVLAKVADKKLRQSASSFEKSIKIELKKLHNTNNNIIKSASSLELPKDLRSIFEILQFVGEDKIPLQQRGDGIQMRHIPEILRFMGEKHNSTRSQGTPSFTYIWGFEEPENSIEMSACFDMRETLENTIRTSESTAQIFLTTHSPIFYRIGNEENSRVNVQSHFVRKPKGTTHSEARPVTSLQKLDQDMGLMPLVASHIEEERNKRIEERNKRVKAEKLLETAAHKPTLLVEGELDERIVKKALSLFFPKEGRQIHVTECGGKSMVNKCADSWPKTRPNLRAAALKDRDSGRSDNSNQKKSPKEQVIHLEWAPDNCIANLEQKGIRLPADLESCYSDKIWKHADKQQGWIKENNPNNVPHILNLSLIINPKTLSPEEEIRIKKKFTDEGKKKAVKYITKLSNDDAKEALMAMEPTLKRIVQHLAP
ncbi:MAG: AAA family ATPase [Hyphomicrobiales bacterium]|nr:AAA family ATPase [Hyphomicrobiales bacterium]